MVNICVFAMIINKDIRQSLSKLEHSIFIQGQLLYY